jgi:hypothetical protein
MKSGIFLRARLDGANHVELAAENRAIAHAQSAPTSHQWARIPAVTALYHSNSARIRCTVAGIPVTLRQKQNQEHQGGTVENFNRDSRLFSRNAHFDSCAGTDEGSGD